MAVHDVIQAGKYMPSNLYVEIPPYVQGCLFLSSRNWSKEHKHKLVGQIYYNVELKILPNLRESN